MRIEFIQARTLKEAMRGNKWARDFIPVYSGHMAFECELDAEEFRDKIKVNKKDFLLKLESCLFEQVKYMAHNNWQSMTEWITLAILAALESGQPTNPDADSDTGNASEPTSRNESGKEVVI